jgi:hypothetical protein
VFSPDRVFVDTSIHHVTAVVLSAGRSNHKTWIYVFFVKGKKVGKAEIERKDCMCAGTNSVFLGIKRTKVHSKTSPSEKVTRSSI